MKNLCYLLLCIFYINSACAQDISGLYSGTLTNDSLKMIQNYELALSEYKGKITGFSYITFVANDTFYYGIKRIKATRVNGELVVEDVQMLMNNYPQKADKGVHLINKIPLPNSDTITDLNGKWETTKTKKFYSISGDMSLRKDDDSTHSPLIAHLKELKMIDYQDDKKQDSRNIAKTEKKQQPVEVKAVATETKSNTTVARQAVTKEIISSKPSNEVASNTNAQEKAKLIETKTQVADVKPNSIASTEANAIQKTNNQKISDNSSKTEESNVAVKKTTPEANNVVVTTPTTTEKNTTKEAKSADRTEVMAKQTELKENVIAPQRTAVAAQPKIEIPEVGKTAIIPALEKRINNTIQTVNVSSDSLVLSFYDNGVVDGDSISVYLNGENVISKVKLKEAAVKKTIYLDNTNDEIRLTLVAENLGSIPPNTGLLIIQDAADKYQIRFSADMETNASVIIKKKKK
jgi:hypothetical protein